MENKSQTLDQSLEKTDFGHFINTHKKTVMSAIAVLLIGLIGFSVYQTQEENSNQQVSYKVFEFSVTKLKEFKENKITKDQLATEYFNLGHKILKNPAIYVLATEVSLELRKQNDLATAIKVLAPVLDTFSKSNFGYYFVAANLAVLYEENNELDNAIKTLETLSQAKVKTMEGKTYFDIARLYKMKGDTAKAKTGFEYVINNFATDEYAKVAKVFLTQMN